MIWRGWEEFEGSSFVACTRWRAKSWECLIGRQANPAKTECDTLPNSIYKQRLLKKEVLQIWSLLIGLWSSLENVVEAFDCKTIETMSELLVLIQGMSWTFGGDWAPVAAVVRAEPLCTWSFTSAALSEGEGMVSDVMWSVPDVLPLEISFNTNFMPAAGFVKLHSGIFCCMIFIFD